MTEQKPNNTPAPPSVNKPPKKTTHKRVPIKEALNQMGAAIDKAVEILPGTTTAPEPTMAPDHGLENGIKPEQALTTVEQDSFNDIVKRIETTIPQMFNDAQRALLLNETPRYKIKRHQGKGGQVFDYVDVGYVVEQLNILTGFQWDFEILSPKEITKDYLEISQTIKQFIVTGRLTLHGVDNKRRFADDSGNCSLKEMRAGGWLDLGNDFKAAISDCIKRCSRQFGIALDVYSGAVKRRQDREHPEAPITDSQRRRLEVLAADAKMGHAGLKKLIAGMFDYTSTMQIQRRHYEQIQAELEGMAEEVLVEEVPDSIKTGFNILGTPPAKQRAIYKAYEKEGKLDELKSKISARVDALQTQKEAGKPSETKPKGGQ